MTFPDNRACWMGRMAIVRATNSPDGTVAAFYPARSIDAMGSLNPRRGVLRTD
jgi:hypothetical protein